MIFEHAMLDLECFGKGRGAVLAQVAAVAFNIAGGPNHHSEDTFFRNIDLQSCLNRGMFVDGSTIEFWMNQSIDARLGLFSPPPVPLDQALGDLRLWLQKEPTVFIWTNTADCFDMPILQEAWECSMAGKVPWSYKNFRDSRTIGWLARHMGWKKELIIRDDKHNALADCLHQIYEVQGAFEYIRKGVA